MCIQIENCSGPRFFSASAADILGQILVENCPVQCRMCISIPELYALVVCSIPHPIPVLTTKNVFRCCQCPQEAKLPLVENNCSEGPQTPCH